VSFQIAYALSGNVLTVPIIFSSLQLFNVIRMPLAFLPNVFSALSNGLIAVGRIGTFLTAEERAQTYIVDTEGAFGVDAHGDFVWETVQRKDDDAAAAERRERWSWKGKGKGRRHRFRQRVRSKWEHFKRHRDAMDAPLLSEEDHLLPIEPFKETMGEGEREEEGKPFELRNLELKVPRGAFVAIVGPVGSGKVSGLSAPNAHILTYRVAEFRSAGFDWGDAEDEGQGLFLFPPLLCLWDRVVNVVLLQVAFGGSVAYVPQTAWIRNATVRENILFGQEYDEDR
jgi:ATP-binding cassette subfamily C (CFTR/MRP) protein 1